MATVVILRVSICDKMYRRFGDCPHMFTTLEGCPFSCYWPTGPGSGGTGSQVYESSVYTASQILFSCCTVIKTTVTFLHRLPLSLPPPPPVIALTSTTTTTPIIWSTPTSHPAMLGEGGGVKNAPPSPPHSPLLRPPQENLVISPIVCRRPAKTSSPSRSWEATKTN